MILTHLHFWFCPILINGHCNLDSLSAMKRFLCCWQNEENGNLTYWNKVIIPFFLPSPFPVFFPFFPFPPILLPFLFPSSSPSSLFPLREGKGCVHLTFMRLNSQVHLVYLEIKSHWKPVSGKAMAPHSSTLAWKIPWMEEPGRLRSMGSDSTEWLHFPFSLSHIGEGNGNPLQCSCLENPRDGGAWWAAVYGVTESRTRLKWLCSSRSRSQCVSTTDN